MEPLSDPLRCRFGAGLVQEKNDGVLRFYRGFTEIGAGLQEKRIEPKSEQWLRFTINKDTNVGTYDHIIYLTDENGLSEPLMLNITVEGTPPGWEVAADMKQ